MKTFVNLCKKPLLIVCTALFVIFTAMLVLSFVTPLGNTFSGSMNLKDTMEEMALDFKVKSSLTFGKDGNGEMKVTFDEAKLKEIMKEVPGMTDEVIDTAIKGMQNTKFKYEKKDGKYIIVEGGSFDIKGNKIVPVNAEDYDKVVPSFVCTANSAVQLTSIVLMVVSGLALAGCVVVTVLANKGVIKTEEKSEAVAE